MPFPRRTVAAITAVSAVTIWVGAGPLATTWHFLRTSPVSTRTSSGAHAALPARLVTCGLFVQHPHLRSRGLVVGFKPLTKCPHEVTSITHTSKLEYWTGAVWLQAGRTITGTNHGAKSYETKGIEYPCTGTQKTTWRGVTMTTIVYEHQTYSRWVASQKVVVACRP